MTAIVIGICAALLGMLADAILEPLYDSLQVLPSLAFQIPDMIDTATGMTGSKGLTAQLSNVFVTTGVMLLTIVFLKKGIETYVLYSDGDPDSDPVQLLTLYCKGIAIVTCGNQVITWFAQISSELMENILNIIRGATGLEYSDTISGLFPEDPDEFVGNLLASVFALVFGILFWIVFFSTLKSGLELFVLRVGLPLACIGLINADKGIFKNFGMSVAKAMVTIIVKVSLTALGFALFISSVKMEGNSIIYACFGSVLGIMSLMLALTAPRLLQEFMVASGGGNGIMKAYYTSQMASKFFRRR